MEAVAGLGLLPTSSRNSVPKARHRFRLPFGLLRVCEPTSLVAASWTCRRPVTGRQSPAGSREGFTGSRQFSSDLPPNRGA
jgi:hypothetical protein